jgi:hypothetical protein
LGPGLFESVYEVVLEQDLVRDGFRVERRTQSAWSSINETLRKHGIEWIVTGWRRIPAGLRSPASSA